MTVISVNSISGITSITAQSGSLNFYTATGNTLPISAGNINIGMGASISSPVNNVLALGTNNTEAVRVTSTGAVGVGTSSFASAPYTKFAVASSGEVFEFSPAWADYNGGVFEYINIGSRSTRPDLNFYINGPGGGSIKFWTGGAEQVRISAAGSFAVGTNSPQSKLHISESTSTAAIIAPSVSTVNSDKVGTARSFYVYIDKEPTSGVWSDTSNRDTFFNNSLYVRTPVRDAVNNPAIVIAENGGQATGRNSLVFWNGDYNIGNGYIKSRIYTEVGNSYNSTAFYIDVADSNRAIQNRLKIDASGSATFNGRGNFGGSSFNTDIALNASVLGETYNASGSISNKNQYYNAGTLFGLVASNNSVNSGCLIDFNAYNSANGATDVYIGAVAGPTGNGPANFVVGRRTGTQSWVESMRVDTSGRVLKPYTPHIFGSLTNTSTVSNSFANSFTVVSSTELTFSTDRITVPVAGVYLITFCSLSNQDSSRKDLYIYINGTQRAAGLSEDTTTGYHYRGITITMKLAANDYIQFYNQNWYANTSTAFDYWRTASVTFLG